MNKSVVGMRVGMVVICGFCFSADSVPRLVLPIDCLTPLIVSEAKAILGYALLPFCGTVLVLFQAFRPFGPLDFFYTPIFSISFLYHNVAIAAAGYWRGRGPPPNFLPPPSIQFTTFFHRTFLCHSAHTHTHTYPSPAALVCNAASPVSTCASTRHLAFLCAGGLGQTHDGSPSDGAYPVRFAVHGGRHGVSQRKTRRPQVSPPQRRLWNLVRGCTEVPIAAQEAAEEKGRVAHEGCGTTCHCDTRDSGGCAFANAEEESRTESKACARGARSCL